MSSTDIGRHAEGVAANYLEAQGFVVYERNWRMKALGDIVELRRREKKPAS